MTVKPRYKFTAEAVVHEDDYDGGERAIELATIRALRAADKAVGEFRAVEVRVDLFTDKNDIGYYVSDVTVERV
jgi:hypothetical protein